MGKISEIKKLRSDFEAKYMNEENISSASFSGRNKKSLQLLKKINGGNYILEIVLVALEYRKKINKKMSLIKFLNTFFNKEELDAGINASAFLEASRDNISDEESQSLFLLLRYAVQDYPKKKVGKLSYAKIWDWLVENEWTNRRKFLDSDYLIELDTLCSNSETCSKQVLSATEDIFLKQYWILSAPASASKSKSKSRSASASASKSPQRKKPTYKQLKLALQKCEESKMMN